MKAIIHCGGKGTRLPAVSKKMPKPMVNINGKPLLFWQILHLKEQGIIDIIITVHHMPEVIMNYFGDGQNIGVNIHYSYEKALLGTGGALTLLKKMITDDTIILYGDVITNLNFKNMFYFHNQNNAIITTAIHRSHHPEDSDLVEFDKLFKLTKLLIKPHLLIPRNPFNLAALYIVNPRIIYFLDLPLPFDIAHNLIPHVIKKGESIFCYNTEELIMDIGTPERLQNVKNIYKP